MYVLCYKLQCQSGRTQQMEDVREMLTDFEIDSSADDADDENDDDAAGENSADTAF